MDYHSDGLPATMKPFWQALAAFFCALLIAGCVSTAPWIPAHVEAELPVEPGEPAPVVFDDDLALVPVSIGSDGPFLFVLDTGASISAIDPAVRNALGYGPYDGETARIVGTAGAEETQALHLDTLQIADHSVHDVRVAVTELQDFQQADSIRYGGILGHDVLQEFDVVYNLADSTLSIHPHDYNIASRLGAPDSLHRIPFRHQFTDQGVITVEVTLGEGNIEGILDTGSRSTVLNWNAARLADVNRDELEPRYRTIGLGSEDPSPTYVHAFDSLYVEDVQFSVEASIADLPVFQSIRSQEVMLMGNNMLRDRLVIFAYSSRELYLSDPLEE